MGCIASGHMSIGTTKNNGSSGPPGTPSQGQSRFLLVTRIVSVERPAMGAPASPVSESIEGSNPRKVRAGVLRFVVRDATFCSGAPNSHGHSPYCWLFPWPTRVPPAFGPYTTMHINSFCRVT